MNKKIIWVEKKLFAIHPTSNRNNIFFSSSLSFHSFVHSIHFALSLVRLGSDTVVSVTRTFDASSISFRSTVWMLQRFVSIYIALFVDFFHIFFGYFFVSNEVTKSKWKKKTEGKNKMFDLNFKWMIQQWRGNRIENVGKIKNELCENVWLQTENEKRLSETKPLRPNWFRSIKIQLKWFFVRSFGLLNFVELFEGSSRQFKCFFFVCRCFVRAGTHTAHSENTF